MNIADHDAKEALMALTILVTFIWFLVLFVSV